MAEGQDASVIHRPIPVVDELTAEFWDAVGRGELVIQFCVGCGRFQHPPASLCLRCGGSELEYRRASGRGRVYSFTVVYRARQVAFEALVPYAVVMVELEEQPGLVMLSNMFGVSESELAIGRDVEFWADEIAPGHWVPQFRLVDAAVTTA
jgi:uncharacterized OB-fold protein